MSSISKSIREIPINAYHLKLRLSRNTFFGLGCPSVAMRIFLISNPFPTMPIANRATATNKSMGCVIMEK